MFWSFGHKACGILAPQPGIKLAHPALEDEVLTTGPPGKPFKMYFLIVYFKIHLRSFELVYAYMCALLCPTLCNTMDGELTVSSPGSSVHAILQARILERAAIGPESLTLVGGFFTCWATKKALELVEESCNLTLLYWRVVKMLTKHWTQYCFY